MIINNALGKLVQCGTRCISAVKTSAPTIPKTINVFKPKITSKDAQMIINTHIPNLNSISNKIEPVLAYVPTLINNNIHVKTTYKMIEKDPVNNAVDIDFLQSRISNYSLQYPLYSSHQFSLMLDPQKIIKLLDGENKINIDCQSEKIIESDNIKILKADLPENQAKKIEKLIREEEEKHSNNMKSVSNINYIKNQDVNIDINPNGQKMIYHPYYYLDQENHCYIVDGLTKEIYTSENKNSSIDKKTHISDNENSLIDLGFIMILRMIDGLLKMGLICVQYSCIIFGIELAANMGILGVLMFMAILLLL